MYENERKDLIAKLSKNGINDIAVLKAMYNVERHLFVPDAMIQHAYKDVALPIGFGQTISQPYTVAFMSQALKLKPEAKVLEIGTGSGFQAAVLEKMGMKVYSIERQFDIYQITLRLLERLNIRVFCKWGDGTIGWDEFAPYDGIIVTAGSPSIPASLKKQLAVGARLVIPVGNKSGQVLKIITRINETEYLTEEEPNFSFVPLIGREGWKD